MPATFDKTDKFSIYNYSRGLLNKCLRDFATEEEIMQLSASDKGRLGKMVEYLYFKIPNNNNPEADFNEAGLEMKCTGLKNGKLEKYLIKERLVCNMINYCEDVNVDFEHSHFYTKCFVMLLLFYLYQKNVDNVDLKFLFAVLWKLPAKDLLIIRNDYETIINKIRNGQAHLLSEGDTIYLGACRKGSSGDALKTQPFSEIKAKGRAFSLKPAYMRTILKYLTDSEQKAVCNFRNVSFGEELVTLKQLRKSSFEAIIKSRFRGFYGKNSYAIAKKLSVNPWHGKDKYFGAANAIAGKKKVSNVNRSEEFAKSGITMKTIRLEQSGLIIQSMSFENIDYQEIFECEEWEDSRLYEIFTSRFMFVVFRNTQKPIMNHDYVDYLKKENETRLQKGELSKEKELSYVLEDVFFWTMSQNDLNEAKKYWEDIREKVLADNIKVGQFWKISDKRKFHVRPKGLLSKYKDESPVTGNKTADKLCYWFNNSFVREIVEKRMSEPKNE